MGYGDLTLDARSSLQEIARMAYGSGLFEGTSGGKGRMGVLFDESGNARVVKFNTHLGERLFGGKQDDEMLLGSNNLRTVLKSIADSAGLPPDARNDIYKKLGIDGTTGEVVAKGLLSRRDVASVVSMIGGDQVWTDAWSSKTKADYRSAEQTQLKDIAPTVNNADSANLRTIGKFAQLTEKGVRNLVGNVRGGLNERQKDLLARVLNEQTIGELVSSGVLNGCSPSRIESRLLAWAKKNLDGNVGIQKLHDSCVAAMKGQSAILGEFLTDAALERFGITMEDLESALTAMANKFKLNKDVERQRVSRIVAAFLSARLEGPNPMLGPKDVQTVLEKIANGTFDGCQIGLLNVGKLLVGAVEGGKNHILASESAHASMLAGMSTEDCENMAYLLAKYEDKKPGDPPWSGPSAFEIQALKDHSASLLKLRETKGFVTLDDISQAIVGCKLKDIKPTKVGMQEIGGGQFGLEWRLIRTLVEKFSAHPGFPALINENDFFKRGLVDDSVYDYFTNILGPFVESLGIRPDLILQSILGSDESIVFGTNVQLFNPFDVDMRKTVEELTVGRLGGSDGDLSRATPSEITIGNETFSLLRPEQDVAGNESKDDYVSRLGNHYTELARKISKAIRDFVGVAENQEPTAQQEMLIKMLILACSQAGNKVLCFSGAPAIGIDHVPTRKSFTKDSNGNIVFGVTSDVGNKFPKRNVGIYEAKIVFEPTGKNHLAGFDRLDDQRFKNDLLVGIGDYEFTKDSLNKMDNDVNGKISDHLLQRGIQANDELHAKIRNKFMCACYLKYLEPVFAGIKDNPVVQELFEMLRSDVKFARKMCETLAGDPNFKNLLGKVNFCKWLVDLKKDPSVTNPLPFGRFVIAPGKIEQLKTLMLEDLRSNLSQPGNGNTTSVIYNDLKRNFSIVYMDKGEKKTLNFKNSTSGQDEEKIENGLNVAFGNNENFINMAKKFLHQGAISFVRMPEFANAFGIAPGCQLAMGGSGDGTEDTSFTITANGVGRYKISTSMSTRLDRLLTAEERSIHFGDTVDGAPRIRMDYSFDLVLTEGKDSFEIKNLTIDTENATLDLPGISSDEEEWLPLWNDDLRE